MHTGRHIGQKSATLPMAGVQDTGDFAIFEEKRHRLGLPTQFQRINRNNVVIITITAWGVCNTHIVYGQRALS